MFVSCARFASDAIASYGQQHVSSVGRDAGSTFAHDEMAMQEGLIADLHASSATISSSERSADGV